MQPKSIYMAKKYIIMAEEGEQGLLEQVQEKLGLDLSDAELIYTGVGAINIIRALEESLGYDLIS